MQVLDLDAQQAGDDSDVGKPVEDEHPAGAHERDAEARHRRPRSARELEGGAVDCDRIANAFFPHQLGDEAVPRRRIEGHAAAQQEAEHIDMPELHMAADRGDAEQHGDHAEAGLDGDEQLAPVDMIGKRSRDCHQQQLRQKLERRDQADGARAVIGEFGQHQPVLRGALHPGADVRKEAGTHPEPEVPVGQRPKRASRQRSHAPFHSPCSVASRNPRPSL